MCIHSFRCAKCGKPADCESNLLILTDGRPVCEACSYTCALCKQLIRDEAIMTGEHILAIKGNVFLPEN